MTDMIGLVAAMLTTISFLPQTLMVLRLEFALAASALERTLGRPLLPADPPTDS